MSRRRISAIASSAAAAALFLCGGASAQSTWNLFSGAAANSQGVTSGCGQNGSNPNSFGNSWNCTVGTGGSQQALTASAWSSNADRGVTTGTYGAYGLTGSGFASAYMSSQGNSGFGATSRLEAQSAAAGGDSTPLDPSSPNHSIDSIAPGSYDLVLLDFGSASVILNQIGIGWTNGDADITLLRWTGTAAPTGAAGTSTMTGDGHQNLLSTLYNSATPNTAGWQLVGNYGDLGTDSGLAFGDAARNTGAAAGSSWWLISTYNTTLSGGNTVCKMATGTSATACTEGGDSFKLNFISTSIAPPPSNGSAPEPMSLALVGVALAGVWTTRRKFAART